MLTKADIEKYFIAEKNESLLFLIVGVAAIIFSICLMIISKTNYWRGFAIPLIIVGLIQFVVGYTVYKRSDADRIRVVYALDMNPDELKNNEVPRMKTVMKNFVVYRYVEIGLALLGLALFFMVKTEAVCSNTWSGNNFWRGIGMALFIQSFLMLCLDFFAEKRGKIYNDLLNKQVSIKK